MAQSNQPGRKRPDKPARQVQHRVRKNQARTQRSQMLADKAEPMVPQSSAGHPRPLAFPNLTQFPSFYSLPLAVSSNKPAGKPGAQFTPNEHFRGARPLILRAY